MAKDLLLKKHLAPIYQLINVCQKDKQKINNTSCIQIDTEMRCLKILKIKGGYYETIETVGTILLL